MLAVDPGALHLALIGAVLILGLISWLVCWLYLDGLQKRLPEEWHRVGSPSSIWRALNSFAFARSVWWPPKEFEDRSLTKLRRSLRLLWIGLLALFLTLPFVKPACQSIDDSIVAKEPQMTWFELVVPPIMIVFMVLLATSVVLSSFFRRRLERFHPASWREMGAPGPAWKSSTQSRRLLVRLQWKGHREFGDPVLSRLAIVQNWLIATLLIVFVAMLASFFIPLPQL